MTPYWQSPDGMQTIYCADNADALALCAPADLVVTSPPYNLGRGGGFYPPHRCGTTHQRGGKLHDSYGDFDDAMPMADYVAWQRRVLQACWGILSERGAILYNQKPRIVEGNLWLPTELNPGLPLRQILTWDRGTGLAVGDGHWCPSYEWVMVFAKPGFRLRDRQASARGDVWRIGHPSKAERWGHKCPFPVALPLRALEETGARSVVDPHMGTGTTLVAAKMLGIRAIGIEIEERHCRTAVRRLAQEAMPFEEAS